MLTPGIALFLLPSSAHLQLLPRGVVHPRTPHRWAPKRMAAPMIRAAEPAGRSRQATAGAWKAGRGATNAFLVDATAEGSAGDEQAEVPTPDGGDADTTTPSIADNPPIPEGYKVMPQSEVTPDMTAWALSILHDPSAYPLFATATKTFDELTVLIRVEWHVPDFQNTAVHRGVTLYEHI